MIVGTCVGLGLARAIIGEAMPIVNENDFCRGCPAFGGQEVTCSRHLTEIAGATLSIQVLSFGDYHAVDKTTGREPFSHRIERSQKANKVGASLAS